MIPITNPRARSKTNAVLFLIRAYNDLDHIAPIIWKYVKRSNSKIYFVFVGASFDQDYRIRAIIAAGARKLEANSIDRYYSNLRPLLGFRLIQKLVDSLVSNLCGGLFLRKNHIGCVVTEWSGPDGKEKAPFFLKGARLNGIPTIAVPHGYHTWFNNDFNTVTTECLRITGKLPQLDNRNKFSTYVIQSENIKRYCIESGIDANKLVVLGSARFCKEWSRINYCLCRSETKFNAPKNKKVVVFFLNHWSYNVDRNRCIRLLVTIAEEDNVCLVIKGHTRGKSTGGLNESEEKLITSYDSVVIADDDIHSPTLISVADMVIVYGSSICFEALSQNVLVCRPLFLCSNRTIFDNSGMVHEVSGEEDVIRLIRNVDCLQSRLEDKELKRFLGEHVDNYFQHGGVLEAHVNLISNTLQSFTNSLPK